jgi:hypothetical protein
VTLRANPGDPYQGCLEHERRIQGGHRQLHNGHVIAIGEGHLDHHRGPRKGIGQAWCCDRLYSLLENRRLRAGRAFGDEQIHKDGAMLETFFEAEAVLARTGLVPAFFEQRSYALTVRSQAQSLLVDAQIDIGCRPRGDPGHRPEVKPDPLHHPTDEQNPALKLAQHRVQVR